MKSIKKFSTEMNQPKSILESIDSKALTELINGMGFKDIHELKKEKALLTKLEALLKEVTPVSEDDAAEIETKILKKATPKSLESKVGKKEPEPAVGSNNEVAEGEDSEDAVDSEEGVDDMSVGELKDLIKTIVDQKAEEETEETETEEETEETETEEETEETETEEETEETETEETETEEELEEESEVAPKATRKIMTFEDFIQEKTDDTKEELEEEELEEEELEEELEEEELEETVASNHTNHSVVKSFSQFVAESYNQSDESSLSEAKISLSDFFDTNIDKHKNKSSFMKAAIKAGFKKADVESLIDDVEQGGDSYTELSKDIFNESSSEVNEADIKSDDEFKEYAEAILKKAFGDDYDEAKAQEVVDGLTSKYSGDYGAMVGALQSTMGS
jgi:X-linked retinitis pigmentosa GTPase regulator